MGRENKTKRVWHLPAPSSDGRCRLSFSARLEESEVDDLLGAVLRSDGEQCIPRARERAQPHEPQVAVAELVLMTASSPDLTSCTAAGQLLRRPSTASARPLSSSRRSSSATV